MATHVSHEAVKDLWTRIRKDEERTGVIPLPAIERIRLYDDQPPTIVLVAPDIVPGATHVFVDLGHLSAADKLIMFALIGEIEDVLRVKQRLTAIFHLGGLDYQFDGTEPDSSFKLEELPLPRRYKAWGILQAIARIGASSPDREASTPVEVPLSAVQSAEAS